MKHTYTLVRCADCGRTIRVWAAESAAPCLCDPCAVMEADRAYHNAVERELRAEQVSERQAGLKYINDHRIID